MRILFSTSNEEEIRTKTRWKLKVCNSLQPVLFGFNDKIDIAFYRVDHFRILFE